MRLADIPVAFRLNYGDYHRLYEPYRCTDVPAFSIGLTPEALTAALPRYPECPEPAYAEHMELCAVASDRLIPYGRFFFHGISFLWHDKAWILTAPSGTGKSTQYILWKLLYGDEISIINGDKPILQPLDDGRILVHSSPWNGKENMGRKLSAPLGGMVLLEQGAQNRISRLTSGAAMPIYSQFLYSAQDCASISAVCRMADILTREVPLWHLRNRGDQASARLCHDTLEEWMK